MYLSVRSEHSQPHLQNGRRDGSGHLPRIRRHGPDERPDTACAAKDAQGGAVCLLSLSLLHPLLQTQGVGNHVRPHHLYPERYGDTGNRRGTGPCRTAPRRRRRRQGNVRPFRPLHARRPHPQRFRVDGVLALGERGGTDGGGLLRRKGYPPGIPALLGGGGRFPHPRNGLSHAGGPQGAVELYPGALLHDRRREGTHLHGRTAGLPARRKSDTGDDRTLLHGPHRGRRPVPAPLSVRREHISS